MAQDPAAQAGRLQRAAAELHGRRRLAEAEALYRRAGTILSAAPPGGPDSGLRVRCALGLAGSLRMQRRPEEAGVILVSALALAEQLLGPSHGDTLATMRALALLSEDLGRTEEAEELYRQALARAEAAAGTDPDEVAGIAASLSRLLERRQRLTGAGRPSPRG